MWQCNCGYSNIGRLLTCANSLTDDTSEHYQISINTLDYFIIRDIINEFLLVRTKGSKTLTEKEELIAKFFNREKIYVENMDEYSLREHIKFLESICIESKARYVAATEKLRDTESKKRLKDRNLLTTLDAGFNGSDLVNTPKLRAARMTKMDKLREQLLKTLPSEIVDEMIRNMEKKGTETLLNKVSSEVKAIEEIKPFQPEVRLAKPEINSEAEEIKEKSEPFDFSTLNIKRIGD